DGHVTGVQTCALPILLLITKPMGVYLTRVFTGGRTWLSPVCVPIERLFYRLCGVNPEEEQKWTGYVIAMLVFSVAGMLLLYLLEIRRASCRERLYRAV